jgi:hypothetical protein
MATDQSIPPGMGMAVLPDRLEGVRSASSFSGLLVDCRGRISLTVEGEGVRATFADPDALRALGALLFDVADQLTRQAHAAATAAAADLERITAAFTPGRKHDA